MILGCETLAVETLDLVVESETKLESDRCLQWLEYWAHNLLRLQGFVG
jgi:hypothetical protein